MSEVEIETLVTRVKWRTCLLKIKTSSLVMTVTSHQQIPLTQWELPETPINFPKHKEKEERTSRQTINADVILCEIDTHDNPLTLLQVYPLQNVVNGRTANKKVFSHNCLKIDTKRVKSFICSLPNGVVCIHQDKTGVTGGA